MTATALSISPTVQFIAPPDVTAELTDAAMSPDGTTIAGAAGDLAVLWEATTGNIMTTFTHPAPIVSVTHNPTVSTSPRRQPTDR